MSRLDALKRQRQEALALVKKYKRERKWIAMGVQKKRLERLDREIARLRGKSPGKGSHRGPKAPGKRAPIRRDGKNNYGDVIARLSKQREAARRRNDRAAVMRYDDMIETVERKQENLRVQDGEQAAYTRAEDASNPEMVDMPPEDVPWFKKPVFWLGGALVVGAVVALKGRKGGGLKILSMGGASGGRPARFRRATSP